MTALEEIKKAFPNMFRPLKWHHFDGPTEHGCGEWYAHATRGMYHIYDVREKFPNDRPFYAKELSDQFDTLELAQEAIQKRHEGDILLVLDPEFLSTLESLQRENEELRKKADARENELVAMLNSADESRVAQIRRAEAAEAELRLLREALKPFGRAITYCEQLRKHGGDDSVRAHDFVISDEFRAARTALSAQVQDVAGWQPIETAPRDGTDFLVFCKSAANHPRFRILAHPIKTATIRNGRITVVGSDVAISNAVQWRPLPAAPAKQEGGHD